MIAGFDEHLSVKPWSEELLSGPEQILANNIIGAAKTESYRRVFFLGPYARRVSFSSQQNRALNLVWALQGLDFIEKGDHVAVVGAGLSGITATAALLDLGYTVTLYEAGKEVMNRQISADHRYIHPSVNWWPDRAIVETTTMPYFDWVSARCSELLDELRKQWQQLEGTDGLTFVDSARATAFRETPNGKWVGVATAKNHPTQAELYRAVLVTSGFADEVYGDRDLFPGYWDPDGLEWRVDQPDPAGKEPRYLVSGCGDGGLIDALRIVHRAFHRGKLIVDVARQLQDLEWSGLAKISEAESSLAQDERRLNAAIDDGSADLEKAYIGAAAELPPEVGKMLDASLRRERGVDFVTLLSREKNPYSPMSAPIHKLLLAHAMDKAVIAHRCCFVVDFSRDGVTVAPCGTKPEDAATAETEALQGHVILRHGAQPNFREFFPEKSELPDLLMKSQKLLAAELDQPLWSIGTEPLKPWPPMSGFARELEQRRNQAAALVTRIAGPATGMLHLDEIHGFLFEHRGDAAVADRVKQLPDTIFGFPLIAHGINALPPTETQACGDDANGDFADPSASLAPGLPIYSALNGRLGPIFEDGRGQLISLTAAHLFPAVSDDPDKPPVSRAVLDEAGSPIGQFVEIDEGAVHVHRDVGFIALDEALAVSPQYGEHEAITDVVNAIDIFAAEVTLLRRDGRNSVGYVSSTWAPVYFRHPGSQKRIVIRDAVRIRSRDPSSPFAQIGDSGAPVIDEAGRLLGMVVSKDADFTYVLPIGNVMCDVGLTLLKAPRPGRSRAPHGGTPLDDLFASTLRLYVEANRRDQRETPTALEEVPAGVGGDI